MSSFPSYPPGSISLLPVGIEARLEQLIKERAAATGDIKAIAHAVIPAGWLLCVGQEVSRTTFAALFAVIGTKYGEGNKSTTFNIPNGQNRALIGSSGTRAVGSTGGAETVKLTIAQLAAHTHPQGDVLDIGGGAFFNNGTERGLGPSTTGSTGEGAAHENMAPYFVGNYIIKT